VAAFIEAYTLGLQHSLLFVVRKDEAARGTTTLRIDDAVPGSLVVRGVHNKANCSRRVPFAEDFSDLAVSHNVSTRNHTNNSEDAFPIVVVSLIRHVIPLFLAQSAQYDAGGGAVTTTAGNFQR